METLPEWMRPPRPEGWYAEDLDNLPEAPRHTELLDGVLVFMLSPQRLFHARVMRRPVPFDIDLDLDALTRAKPA